MPLPGWLPELFPVNPWEHDTYERLYRLFEQDFKESRPVYDGSEVWYFPELEDGYEKLFWHLTSREDNTTTVRLPDPRRSEFLSWVRPLIEHSDDPEVLSWNYYEGDGTIKTYIWLENHDFVVILKKYPNGRRRLVTAYWIEYENAKRKLRRKYENRINP